jgi:hypothetical protein
MPRYQIKVNVSGSWANLCSAPPERIAAVMVACESLAAALDHGIVFKVIDAASEATAWQFNSRPKPGEPHGWYVPFQPCGAAPLSNPAQGGNP